MSERRRVLMNRASEGTAPFLASFKNEVVWYNAQTSYDAIQLYSGNAVRVRSGRSQIFLVPLDFSPQPNHRYLLEITSLKASDARYESETYIRMYDASGVLTTPFSTATTGKTSHNNSKTLDFVSRSDSAVFYIGYYTRIANTITIGDVYVTDLGKVSNNSGGGYSNRIEISPLFWLALAKAGVGV